ncbi:ChaN family lipoprotein [Almyronema epifaneia]|uniref:ChaN family lipoprotein n=1 Tax=Almyronema epifaneia S1 TaxID=2991925 RepID=A0ABW6ID13_9CYAN
MIGRGWIAVLVVWLVMTPPAIAQALPFLIEVEARIETAAGEPYAADSFVAELAAAEVVYLGETHTRAADHLAELAILTALYQANPHLALGLEMFQRPFQPVLDRYLAGEIDAATLRQQSEYDSRWHYPWQYYAPILHFAQTHQIPLVALTAPAEVTERVALKGPQALQPDDLRYVPAAADWELGPPPYRQLMQALYKEIHQGLGAAQGFDRFFTVQILWDETMAAAIAQFYQTHHRPVLVLAGQGHLVYNFGIPDRVQRRLGSDIQQQTVLLNPATDLAVETERAIADFLWHTPLPPELAPPNARHTDRST